MFPSRFVLMATVAAALIAAPVPAMATTYRVSGEQVLTDADTQTYEMTGGLVGTWRVVSGKEVKSTDAPIVATGIERFAGCIDVELDGACAGDPTGTLRIRYRYWALPGASADSIVWGSCWHKVVRGRGGLKGARGVLTMIDTPEGDSVRTDYIGNVTLGAAGRRAPTPRSCG
jgi:hypothetical protein